MTRSLPTVVLLVSFVCPAILARAADLAPHVRGMDAWARESIARGLDASALVRELVGRLEASDVIVHVETSDVMPRGLGGMTRFAAATGDCRYVRITLLRSLDPDVRAATLAHELQHAWELASSPARSRLDMQRLYETIGFRISRKRTFYETVAAEQAGARAWAELRRSSPPRAAQQ